MDLFLKFSQVENHLKRVSKGGHYHDNMKKWASLILKMLVTIREDLKMESPAALIQLVCKHCKFWLKNLMCSSEDKRNDMTSSFVDIIIREDLKIESLAALI